MTASTATRAVIDCGSNSTRLWLRPDPDGPVERRERVTRLGQGVDASQRLHPDAMDRTLAVVERYAQRWREAGVDDGEVVVIATSAVRDADNAGEFRARMERVAGVAPRVLDGREEAAASFLGATGGIPVGTQCLVIDIGGGSTELVVGLAGDDDLAAVSLQLGTVRLTERCLHDDPPSAAQVAEARRFAGGLVAGGLAEIGLDGGDDIASLRVVAVAGTATTLAGLDAGSDDPLEIDGHRLTAAAVHELAADLAGCSVSERLTLGPLDVNRADVIAAGAIILDEVLGGVAAGAVDVSVADVMDGIAARS